MNKFPPQFIVWMHLESEQLLPGGRSQIFSSWRGRRGQTLSTVNSRVFTLASWLTENPRQASPPAAADLIPSCFITWASTLTPADILAGRQNEARRVPETHTHIHDKHPPPPPSPPSVQNNRPIFQRYFSSVSSGQQFVFTSAALCQLSKQQERLSSQWILLLHQPSASKQQVGSYIMLSRYNTPVRRYLETVKQTSNTSFFFFFKYTVVFLLNHLWCTTWKTVLDPFTTIGQFWDALYSAWRFSIFAFI